jgi:hypothetical protein
MARFSAAIKAGSIRPATAPASASATGARDGYIRLGKLIDATVKFAAYSGDSRVDALRRHLVAEVVQAQEPDGSIGTYLRLRDFSAAVPDELFAMGSK